MKIFDHNRFVNRRARVLAFVSPVVVNELLDLTVRREDAEQVKVDTMREFCVVYQRQLRFLFLRVASQQTVDGVACARR